MQATDFTQWKRALLARRRTHAAFVVLFVAANMCYLASSVVGAVGLLVVGFVVEIAGWFALSDEDNDIHRRGGLK